jgi:hypothetical protein
MLKELSVIDASSIQELYNSIVWSGGGITLGDHGEVAKISYPLPYRLEVQDLIALKGDPDGFVYVLLHPDQKYGEINLIWPDQGFMVFVTSFVDRRDFANTSPIGRESLINQASYFEPVRDAEAYFLTFFGPSPNPRTPVLEFYEYYQWKGYVPIPRD